MGTDVTRTRVLELQHEQAALLAKARSAAGYDALDKFMPWLAYDAKHAELYLALLEPSHAGRGSPRTKTG